VCFIRAKSNLVPGNDGTDILAKKYKKQNLSDDFAQHFDTLW